ncbi:MAG: hypothetical protein WAL50_03445 [Kineosporiaceae bacterium]
MVDLGVAMAAAQKAQEADEKFWHSERNSTPHRIRRNRAVVEALAAGMSLEQLADELGVSIADVERMATDGAAAT